MRGYRDSGALAEREITRLPMQVYHTCMAESEKTSGNRRAGVAQATLRILSMRSASGSPLEGFF